MDTFKTATAAPVVDPTKHVNYNYGMVLGVDDFTQEFAYHSNRDRWAARDIEGYGTLVGLRVTVEENKAGEPEVVVTAGTALNPRGQLIRVPVAQCAEINRWLAVAKNRAAAAEIVGEPPAAPLGLYVVLCYRECPTDSVPVPGEPCRSEEESLAPSRLKDGFLLELRLEAPRQTEEDAVRDFVRWMVEHTEFTDEPGAFTDLEEFLARLREAAGPVSSPPGSPPASPPSDFMQDSPPDVMRVESNRRGEFLRAAFRLWVTELRPRWRPAHFDEPCCCAGAAHGDKEGDDDCLLLAELSVPLTPGFQVDAAAGVGVNEERRPYLLHQRMLQEWLLDGSCCAPAPQTESPPASPPTSPPSSPPTPPAELALDDLIDVDAPLPQEGEVLTFSGGQWIASEVPLPPGGGPTGPASGDLEGSYPDPTVARLRGSLIGSTAPGPAGQVLTWNGSEWIPADLPESAPAIRPGDPAGGDLEGTYPDPTVARLRGSLIASTAPGAAGQVLTWNGSEWGPAALPPDPPAIRPGDAAGGDLEGSYPNPTVARLQERRVGDLAPTDGDVLTWNETEDQWLPAPPAAAQPGLLTILPFVTVIPGHDDSGNNRFFFWFNLEVPGNHAEIIVLTPSEVEAFAESINQAEEFLNEIEIKSIAPRDRNLFLCEISINPDRPRPKLMRFRFNLGGIKVVARVVVEGEPQRAEMTLLQYATSNRVNFVGFDGDKTVTTFVADRPEVRTLLDQEFRPRVSATNRGARRR